MQISITKMERDVYMHIFYYLVLYAALIIVIINLLKIDNLETYIQIGGLIFLVYVVFKLILFVKKYVSYYSNNKYLTSNGVRIKAVVDKMAFTVTSDRIMEVCNLVAYYTKGEETYIFEDDIWYFGSTISRELLNLKKEGRLLSHIDILVDPNNYKKYIILKYDYLYNLFEYDDNN